MTERLLDNLQAIRQHPYITQPDLIYPTNLIGQLDDLASFEREVLGRHEVEPIDALIGDDVSGRVPTLITHGFLQLAQTAGRIETTPHTYFMASGMSHLREEPFNINSMWKESLALHARRIVDAINAKNVLVITDVVVSGTSVDRLQNAFSAHGVHASYLAFGTPYLHNHDVKASDRIVVGVEKYAPEATSRRRPEFNGRETAALRLFLKVYTKAVYESVFNEPAPTSIRWPRLPVL